MKETIKLGLAILSLSVFISPSFAAEEGVSLGLGLATNNKTESSEDLFQRSGTHRTNPLGNLDSRKNNSTSNLIPIANMLSLNLTYNLN